MKKAEGGRPDVPSDAYAPYAASLLIELGVEPTGWAVDTVLDLIERIIQNERKAEPVEL